MDLFRVVILASFAVLGYFCGEIYRQAPPVPERVATSDGRLLFDGQDINDGQNVWQSMGGQQLGGIWGHGAYVVPDWLADWLHRKCLWLLNHWARDEHQQGFAELDEAAQAPLLAGLKSKLRTNTFDSESNDLVISIDRAAAIEALGRYYAAIFGDATEFDEDIRFLPDGQMTPAELRDAYAIPARTIRDENPKQQLNAFFFWTSWACATKRPDAGETATAADDARASVLPVGLKTGWSVTAAQDIVLDRPHQSFNATQRAFHQFVN